MNNLQINLYIGDKQIENKIRDFADCHELLYKLTNPNVFNNRSYQNYTKYQKYDHALYMNDLTFINIDSYMKKFVKLLFDKKIKYILKYILKNEPKYILLYTEKINLRIFHILYNSKIPMVIKYVNESDITSIKQFNVIFERIEKNGEIY